MNASTAAAIGFALLAMLVLGALSLWLQAPLLFPAIGASAAVVLLAPASLGAQPKSILLGHALGGVLGWICVQTIAGGAQGSLVNLTNPALLVSGSVALAATVLALMSLRVPHPPAAATTMIVGMGLLPRAEHVLALIVSAGLAAAATAYAQRHVRP